MIRHVLATTIALLLVYAGMRWDLRGGKRGARWFACAVLALSGAIWVYVSAKHDIFRPGVWLERILKPFDPIR